MSSEYIDFGDFLSDFKRRSGDAAFCAWPGWKSSVFGNLPDLQLSAACTVIRAATYRGPVSQTRFLDTNQC